MKKIDLGQATHILANIGVLGGILLLVYELSLNRQLMEIQARSDIANTFVDIQMQSATSPELEAATVKASSGAPMTPVEAEHYADLQRAMWTYRANVAYLFRSGLYEESEYLAQKDRWARFLTGSQRDYWCDQRDQQPVEFAAEIDELLENPCE